MLAATARGASAAMSAARARAPGSTVTMARSSPNGITSVWGVRAAREPATMTPAWVELVADELAREVVAQRRHQPRCAARAAPPPQP